MPSKSCHLPLFEVIYDLFWFSGAGTLRTTATPRPATARSSTRCDSRWDSVSIHFWPHFRAQSLPLSLLLRFWAHFRSILGLSQNICEGGRVGEQAAAWSLPYYHAPCISLGSIYNGTCFEDGYPYDLDSPGKKITSAFANATGEDEDLPDGMIAAHVSSQAICRCL